MDARNHANRKDDFKAYTAPRGVKQEAVGVSAFVAAVIAPALNVDSTTAVQHDEECAYIHLQTRRRGTGWSTHKIVRQHIKSEVWVLCQNYFDHGKIATRPDRLV
jgi:hypothetical protein